jgi:hypothetical protein
VSVKRFVVFEEVGVGPGASHPASKTLASGCAVAHAGILSTPQRTGRHMPTVECLYCEAKLDAPVEYKGRLVKCSVCGKSFVLRFTGHDLPFVAVKVSRRPSEPTPELRSTVSFRLPDTSDSGSAPKPTARAPERADLEAPVPQKPRRKKPHREK